MSNREPSTPNPPFEQSSAIDAIRGMSVLYGGPLALAGWSAVSMGLALRAVARTHKLLRLPIALGAIAPAIYYPLVRPRILSWGATGEELTKQLPGDEIVDNPLHTNTRAITIDAPPDEVWRWLVQIGYQRGGWYSYDALEAAAGAGDFLEGHSATRIHAELQDLNPGDMIRMSPWTGLQVRSAEPGRVLALESVPIPGAMMAKTSWSMVLEPTADGNTRLLIRGRASSDPRNILLGAFDHLIELPHFLMERKLMLGIKQRAEAAARPAASHNLIDDWAPNLQFVDTISVDVDATPEAIFAAFDAVTLQDMPVASALGGLRYLPGRLLGREAFRPTAEYEPFVTTLKKSGTVVLAQEPGREVVFGGAGKYHQLADQEPVPFVDAAAFIAFDEPEYQKLVMSLRVEPAARAGRYRLILEHRTQPLSDAARRGFARYWRVIKPTGAFVTKQLLNATKKRAEAGLRQTMAAT
jgi:hypothetical protein